LKSTNWFAEDTMATIATPAARLSTRRWALIASFALFLALCASLAYWGMQLFKPPARPVAPAPQAQVAPISTTAAATLFGGKSGTEANAGNFQLKGLVMASSLAATSLIMSIDGKPAQAFRANSEIAPGVTVKEVQPDHVVLSDNGVPRRVELPAELLPSVGGNTARTDPRAQAASRNTTPPPRTMPSAANTPTPGSPAMPAQQMQQSAPQQPVQGAQPNQASQPAQTQVPPGVPVPANQAPVANPGASSGASGIGSVAAGGGQQPVYVQSPPNAGGAVVQGQTQAGAQPQVQGQTQVPAQGQSTVPGQPSAAGAVR
jgi:general secretion pathway protein C